MQKAVPKNFAIFRGTQLCWSLSKQLSIAKFLKTPNLRMAVSEFPKSVF